MVRILLDKTTDVDVSIFPIDTEDVISVAEDDDDDDDDDGGDYGDDAGDETRSPAQKRQRMECTSSGRVGKKCTFCEGTNNAISFTSIWHKDEDGKDCCDNCYQSVQASKKDSESEFVSVPLGSSSSNVVTFRTNPRGQNPSRLIGEFASVESTSTVASPSRST